MVVVSHRRYAAVPGLFLGVPLTSVDRHLPHHVRVDASASSGLERTSYAMTEQVRVLSLGRVERTLGVVDPAVFAQISRFVHLFVA